MTGDRTMPGDGDANSEAGNELIQPGLVGSVGPPRFHRRTRRLGLRVDVSNVADALDQIEGPLHR